MKKNTLIRFGGLIIVTLLFGASLSSCKKDKGNGEEPEPPATGLSDADSLKYLMYRTMQVSFVDGGRDKTYQLPTYYWYNQVPELNPLSTQYDSAGVLLNRMKTYPKGPDGKLVDKYSFLDNGQVAGEIQQGVAGDLGMEVTFARNGTGPNDIVLVVLHSDKNGPAGNAGVKRGYQITKINGSNVVYDNNGPGVQNVIKAIYRDAQATFTFKKQDGISFTKELNRAVYPINPVLFDSVYNVAGKKVGYFVFNTFSNITNNNAPTLTKTELDRVFSKFEGAGISNLIVDFRYNGGGSVNTADYITSKIAPQSANGKVMYKYKYNDKLTAMSTQVGLPGDVKFENTGNFNLENVFFISGDQTASASELVMNNLKPYMNVRIVGDTTYGKPVGFFSFTISIFKNGVEKDLADLYAINFETVNSAGEGGFYHGIAPHALAGDFVGEPWGGSKDENLIKIFNYISTGSYGRMSSMERMSKDKSLQIPVRSAIQPMRFNGMVDYKMGEVIKKEFEKGLGR